MSAVRSCPVCSCLEVEELHRHRFVLFDGHPLAGDCSTVICKNCSMAFNQTTAPAEVYDSYYASLSKYAISFSPPSGESRFTKTAKLFSALCPDKNLSILDVGCGSGGILASLRDLGYDRLTGLDPSPSCVELVKNELGIEAKVGTLDDPPFKPESFDVVVSTGVFEHLLSPIKALSSIAKLLASGRERGGAFIMVPDASRYVDYLDSPLQDFNVEHINHFNPRTLSYLFELQGWTSSFFGGDKLSLTSKWTEPIAYGLFSHNNSKNISVKTKFDMSFKSKILDYIDKSTKLLDKIDKNLRKNLLNDDEVILWGCGQLSSLLLSQTVLGEKKLRAVLDSNPVYRNRRLVGAPVGGPELKGDFDGPVVISSIREHHSIESQIKDNLGWNNRIISLI
ncbi:MAG: class I SAM-dependent methyltransferase [Deltaproteobacteria bacterium]|jgi:SAM-dependent methyltransferase|nr:class I SAM-dependent methyltransferase [Deltaproteobacteria bacterium]